MSTRAEEGMRAGFQLKLAMFEDHVVPSSFIPLLSSFKTREVREEDIFLCTYPKSGNGGNKEHLSIDLVSLYDDTTYLYTLCTYWTWEILNMILKGEAKYEEHRMCSTFMDERNEEVLDNIPSPRILVTHVIPGNLPTALWERKCHVINVQRNPKDVAGSFYCHVTNQNWQFEGTEPSFNGSWENFIDAYIKGNSYVPAPNDSVFDHNLSWNKVPEDYPDVPFLQIHYEDLKKNAVTVVKQLAEFINHPLPDKVYEEIAEACRFTKLKHAHKHVKNPTYYNPWIEGSTGHFRKGETGDWKNWFTVAQSERFDRMYEQKFHRSFPY